MQSMLQRIRENLASAENTVSLERARVITEAYRMNEAERPVIRRAKAFAHLLDHMTLDLLSNPVFAGNTSEQPRAWALLPEYGFTVPGQALVEHDWPQGFLEGDRVPADLREFWHGRSFGTDAGIGHLAIDLDLVVHGGLQAVVDEAQTAGNRGNKGQRDFRRAVVIAGEAVMRWAERYRLEAERLSDSTDDPAVRAALARVARALRQVPAQPARDLFEGLQAIVLAHLATALEGHGFSISLGLVDRVLAPFAGEVADATDLFGAFMLKVAANSVWGSFSKTQAITVGGLDHRGRDQCNGLTLACLEACRRMRLPDPHVFLRWHRDMSSEVKRKALDMLGEGLTLPLLVGDEETAAGFTDVRVPAEDAWRYCVIGCNELGIPGRLSRSATGPSLNYAALLRDVILQARPEGMDALLPALEAAMEGHLADGLENEERFWRSMAERVPTPFTSSLMTGAVARGEDLHAGAVYPHGGLFERGLVNAVNGLAAIEQLVTCGFRFSMDAIARALEDDFQDEQLRAALLAAPKWGNDVPGVDAWAVRLLEMRDRCLDRLGGRPRLSCHVVRSLHWVDGMVMGATPDGRKAGDALASSIGPETWDVARGPTAALASVNTIPARTFYRGGYNLNLTLSPQGGFDDGLAALVETFFELGGQELQVSVLDPAQLRDAMAHPARHRDLLVRIAGFTGRFIELAPREQTEILRRAEAAAARAG